VEAIASAATTDEASISPISPDDQTPPKVVDKGKGKEKEITDEPQEITSPAPMSPLPPPKDLPPPPPQVILLAGLAMAPAAVSQLLTKASSELPLRSVRFPLLGEYNDAFSGEEFVVWIKDNVPGLGGDWDLAEQAASELTEREGLLRRLGEFGNRFEGIDDAFYQFRPKVNPISVRPSNTHLSTGIRPWKYEDGRTVIGEHLGSRRKVR